MNLYLWIDENGDWRVAHRPSANAGEQAVMLLEFAPGHQLPVFRAWNTTGNEIEIEV
jgi:hypothetical protein